jgi:hypothetical protein
LEKALKSSNENLTVEELIKQSLKMIWPSIVGM